jgi:hypothetical protein
MTGSNSTKELASSLHILSIVAISSSVNFYRGKKNQSHTKLRRKQPIFITIFFSESSCNCTALNRD